MTTLPEDLPKVWNMESPERRMLVGPLPEGAIVSLTGEPGCGKSTFALALAGQAALSGVPVLYLDRENPLSVIKERTQLMDIGPACTSLCYWGGWLDEEAPKPSSEAVVSFVLRHPRCLVVIDSQSPFFDGDENDSAAMSRYFAPLRRIAHEGGTVLNLHHSGKAETARDFRGSSAFKASIDAGYKAKPEHRDGLLVGLTLQGFKNRSGPLGDLSYRYRNGRFLLASGDDKDDILAWATSMVERSPGIHKGALETAAQAEGFPRQAFRRALEQALRDKLLEPKAGNGKTIRLFLPGSPNRHP